MKTKGKAYPFPSSILHLILLTIAAVFITALFMISIPIENIEFFDNAFDNQWVSDSIIVYVLMSAIIGATYVINAIRRQKFSLFRKDSTFDWRLCALVLFAMIMAHYVLIVPFNSIFWGAPDIHTHKTFWFIITTLFLTPIFEEFVFRGVFLKALSARYAPSVSIAITAVAFALFHFDYHLFFGAFIMGLLLSVLYLKSNKNLLLCIICHILANTLSFLGCYNLALYGNRIFSIILLAVSLGFVLFFGLYSVKRRRESSEGLASGSEIELVTVASYTNEAIAEIAKERLIASGIDAMIDGTVSFYPDFNQMYPIELKVRKEDLAAASELLASKDDGLSAEK